MDYKKTHIEHSNKHVRPLISCRFALKETAVFYGSEDYSVWKWNWVTNAKVEYTTDAWVRSLAFVEEGKVLITGGYDGRLIWWPSATEKPTPIRTVDAHKGWIRAIDVSPDGTLIASVGNDLVVRFWDAKTGSKIREFVGQDPKNENALRHRSYIYNVAFHPDKKSFVTGDLYGNLIHWDIESGEPQRTWTAKSLSKYDKTFRAQIGGFRCLKFDSKGTKLLASGITNVTNAFAGVGNPSVVEFDWKEGKQLIEYLSKPKLQGVAWGLGLHTDGTIIAVHGGSGGNLMFWKPGTAEASHQLKLPQNGRDLDLNSTTNRIAVACSDGQLRICLMDEKQPVVKKS